MCDGQNFAPHSISTSLIKMKVILILLVLLTSYSVLGFNDYYAGNDVGEAETRSENLNFTPERIRVISSFLLFCMTNSNFTAVFCLTRR